MKVNYFLLSKSLAPEGFSAIDVSLRLNAAASILDSSNFRSA